jgi:hypothetical protein
MHEVCIDIEFTKEERRTSDFPPSCAKVQVTPDLLERICRANESKMTGGALFSQSERWIRTMPKSRSANWQRVRGVGKYRGKGATHMVTPDETTAWPIQSTIEQQRHPRSRSKPGCAWRSWVRLVSQCPRGVGRGAANPSFAPPSPYERPLSRRKPLPPPSPACIGGEREARIAALVSIHSRSNNPRGSLPVIEPQWAAVCC